MSFHLAEIPGFEDYKKLGPESLSYLPPGALKAIFSLEEDEILALRDMYGKADAQLVEEAEMVLKKMYTAVSGGETIFYKM